MATWKNGDTYSAQDMMRMQREAEERVREMQERSRRALSQGPTYPAFAKRPVEGHSQLNRSTPSTPEPHPAESLPEEPIVQSHHAASGSVPIQVPEPRTPHPLPTPTGQSAAPPRPTGILGSLSGLLGGGGDGTGPISRVMEALHIDNDRLLLLILLFVLLNNNTDKKLILALCYIML